MADRSLEGAFGVGTAMSPVEAVRRVALALDEGRVPEPSAARLVAAALRRCLAGRKARDRDLLRAIGVVVPQGGKAKTPAALDEARRQAQALRDVLDVAPGQTAAARAEFIAQQLSGRHATRPVVGMTPELAGRLEVVRQLGVKATTARAIRGRIARAESRSDAHRSL